MPTSRVERLASSPQTRRSRVVLLLSLLLTSVMSVTLIACAGSSAVKPPKSPKSPLSAVPPSPGMLLLRDSPSGDSPAGLAHALGVIVAVNLQNGQVLWRHSLDLPSPQAVEEGKPLQPLLQGGLIYVPENYANQQGDHAFGELVALDPATGQERWTYTIAPATADLVTELDSEPVEANGVVYLTANERSASAPLPPPQDQSLPTLLVQAVDSRTGSLLWSRTLSGFDSSPDVGDGNVILLGNRGLVALRTTDGSLAWTFTPAGPYPYTAVDDGGPPNEDYAVGDGYPGPVIINHLVLVDAIAVGAGGQGLGATWFAVSTSTGKLVWQSARSVLGGSYTRPVLNQSGDVLCTSGTSVEASSYVLGLAASTGKTLWNHSTHFRAVDVRRVRQYLLSFREERAGDLWGAPGLRQPHRQAAVADSDGTARGLFGRCRASAGGRACRDCCGGTHLDRDVSPHQSRGRHPVEYRESHVAAGPPHRCDEADYRRRPRGADPPVLARPVESVSATGGLFAPSREPELDAPARESPITPLTQSS